MFINITSGATPEQFAALSREIADFAARDGRAPERVEMHPSVYASTPEDREMFPQLIGAVSYTLSHSGTKADRSDWSMSSSTLLASGEHYDTDPPKPWEL